jgi:hypothetical protein
MCASSRCDNGRLLHAQERSAIPTQPVQSVSWAPRPQQLATCQGRKQHSPTTPTS